MSDEPGLIGAKVWVRRRRVKVTGRKHPEYSSRPIGQKGNPVLAVRSYSRRLAGTIYMATSRSVQVAMIPGYHVFEWNNFQDSHKKQRRRASRFLQSITWEHPIKSLPQFCRSQYSCESFNEASPRMPRNHGVTRVPFV